MNNHPIKFRAFHKPTKRMFPVYGFNKEYVFEDTLDGIYSTETNPARIEDCILMQFAGLENKDGKEIYEGDILTFTCIYGFHSELLHEWKELNQLDSINGIGSLFKGIICVDIQRGLMLKRLDNNYAEPLFGRSQIIESWFELETCDIAGNIYQNPELI